MAFNFSALFTPERAMQGMQGVQAINQMPWVWNGYTPQGAAAMSVAHAPAAPAAPAQPDIVSQLAPFIDNPGDFTPDAQAFWTMLMRNYNDGGGGQ